MQNMQIELSFKGKARLHELWRLITRGKVFSFLTESNILSIWKQYSDQRIKEQLNRQLPPKETVAK